MAFLAVEEGKRLITKRFGYYTQQQVLDDFAREDSVDDIPGDDMSDDSILDLEIVVIFMPSK